MDTNPPPTIQDLFPSFTAPQSKEAEENLEQYIALVVRIYERIRLDPEAYLEFHRLTEKTSTR